MNRDQEVENRPISPPILEAEIPGFEFELEENVSQISSAESVNSVRIPNFAQNRHPNTKLFVVIFAILGLILIIYQSIRDIPKEFRSILFSDSDRNPKIIEYIEFIIRLTMEFFMPLSMIMCYSFTHFSISLFPQLAFKIRNPVPMLTKSINITMFFHALTCFFTSIAMLPFLGTTVDWSFWREYLTVSGFGLFWMYQLLNMNAFSRLTVFNFIRARENFEMRQNAHELNF